MSCHSSLFPATPSEILIAIIQATDHSFDSSMYVIQVFVVSILDLEVLRWLLCSVIDYFNHLWFLIQYEDGTDYRL
ncbi:hypothetical protein Hdeb2414_s0575g00918951 [Helianthus debilis subsp. tardiflorus]